ncbi:MAG: ATP-binding protein, partial [Muribaculaceae bacterium]|nr:ATP-binding protein [Muribaculaceae bacterium]
VNYTVNTSKKADFRIDNNIFEVGGKNKGQRQLDGNPDGYIVKDDIEYGSGNIIPLWHFGLTY